MGPCKYRETRIIFLKLNSRCYVTDGPIVPEGLSVSRTPLVRSESTPVPDSRMSRQWCALMCDGVVCRIIYVCMPML